MLHVHRRVDRCLSGIVPMASRRMDLSKKTMQLTPAKSRFELIRFPVPNDVDQVETDSEPGLVRAADLIGQLSDPRYPQNLRRSIL
jgi:hypothetical protein